MFSFPDIVLNRMNTVIPALLFFVVLCLAYSCSKQPPKSSNSGRTEVALEQACVPTSSRTQSSSSQNNQQYYPENNISNNGQNNYQSSQQYKLQSYGLQDPAGSSLPVGSDILKENCQSCHESQGLKEANEKLLSVESLAENDWALAIKSVNLALTGHVPALTDDKKRLFMNWARNGFGRLVPAEQSEVVSEKIDEEFPVTNYFDHVVPLMEETDVACTKCHSSGGNLPDLTALNPTFTTDVFKTTNEGLVAFYSSVVVRKTMPQDPRSRGITDIGKLKYFVMWKLDGYLRDGNGASFWDSNKIESSIPGSVTNVGTVNSFVSRQVEDSKLPQTSAAVGQGQNCSQVSQ